MKVPPACTYRSRIANETASSVSVPNRCVPRARTLTARRVLGSVPIVQYFIRGSFPAAGSVQALSVSLDAGGCSRSSQPAEAGVDVPALAAGQGACGRLQKGSRSAMGKISWNAPGVLGLTWSPLHGIASVLMREVASGE